jgi:hypothetical protein
MPPRTFKQNTLFRGLTAQSRFNACVGNNGGPYDLYDYAHGYFEAARLLLTEAQKPGIIIDTIVYPICLNLRHAIELYIKYLITDLAKAMKSKETFKRNHSLKENWDIAVVLLKAANLKVTDKQVAIMDVAVNAVMEIDPTGTVFRYPDSFKDEKQLKDWSLINLIVLEMQYKQIFEVAYNWHHKLESRLGR